MKTITEFSGFYLKDIAIKKTKLVSEGKPEEEIWKTLQEELKLDETKTALLKHALTFDLERAKRIVVATKTENETPPSEFKEFEGSFYKMELFPAPAGSGKSFSKDKRKGGRGGRGDRGSDRKDHRPRPDRFEKSERPNTEAQAPRFKIPTPATALNRPAGDAIALTPPKPFARPKKSSRPPRPARAPSTGPKGATELRLVLKGKAQQTLVGSQPEVPVQEAAPVTVTAE